MVLSIVANELLDCFLWKDISTANKDLINNEVADVFSYLLYIATDL
jgi:hypothetical protein